MTWMNCLHGLEIEEDATQRNNINIPSITSPNRRLTCKLVINTKIFNGLLWMSSTNMKLGENVSLFRLKLISEGISSLIGDKFLSVVGGS